MPPERGDQKPCTRTGCTGMMRFGREPLPSAPSVMSADGAEGWVCSSRSTHFQRASEANMPAATPAS